MSLSIRTTIWGQGRALLVPPGKASVLNRALLTDCILNGVYAGNDW